MLDPLVAALGPGDVADLATALSDPFRLVELGSGRLVCEATTHVGTERVPVVVRKTIELGGERTAPELRVGLAVLNVGDRSIRARLGLEWGLMLLGGGGNPSAFYEVGGVRRAHDSAGEADGVDVIRQGNDWIGLTIETTPGPRADAWWAPIETVSNSEGGFERVYQGSALLISWPIDLGPGAALEVEVQQRVLVAVV